MHMTGRTVLITGASRGIGAECARVFAAAGAQVVLVARGADRIAELAGQIGPNALAVPCDVSVAWQTEQAAQAAVDTFGGIDVLVNNAGVVDPIAPLAEADPEAWGRGIDINLKGTFHMTRACLPALLDAAGGGCVLTVSSGAAHRAYEGWSSYCAAKAGVAMLAQSLHAEYGAAGLRSVALSPGTVATDMQRVIAASGVNPVSRLAWEDHIPADWPARALLWLAGPEGAAHAGQEVSLRDDAIRRAAGLVT